MRTLSLFVIFLVAIPAYYCSVHDEQGHGTIWRKLNKAPVCFEGKGNKPGIVQNFGRGSMVGAVKLVYKSGSIHCSVSKAHDSRWGCYHFTIASIASHPLNVVITDESNNKIYPLDKYVTHGFGRVGLWYYLPFADAKHSDALVFTNYRDPFYLPNKGQLKVWYGEDYRNFYEGDNVGRVCVDVYVHGIA